LQSGDTISGIAESNGITQDALLAANPSVTNPNAIQVLNIYSLAATCAEMALAEALPSMPRQILVKNSSATCSMHIA